MYGIEIIGSIFICVFLSVLAFLLARKSFTDSDIIESKEEVKQKNKTTKKNQKVKVAKKETTKSKEVKKVEEEIKVEKKSKKAKHSKAEKTENVAPVVIEKVSTESSVEWKKVSKPARKISKKEGKVDLVLENEASEIDDIQVTNVQEQPIIVKEPSFVVKTETISKSKKEESTSISRKNTISSDEIKLEEKKPEIKIKQNKEKVIVDDSKLQTANEEMDLRRRIGELMSELDKQKSLNKEENKTSLQTINQLNKEIDTLKQKTKISQSSEEKLSEELKKKNSSFAEFRQQYVIVQSELTKNIVQVQSITREKDKLEIRLKSSDESNLQLREKSDRYDEVNTEREQHLEKLSKVEEEYTNTKIKFNELFQAKEKEANEIINQLQSNKQKLQEQLVNVQTDLIEKNSKLQHIQQELLNTKSTYTDLLNDKIRLQQNCVDLENANILIKQQLLLESSTRDKENNDNVALLKKKWEDSQSINEKLVQEKEALMKQYEDSKTALSEVRQLKEQLTENLNTAKDLLAKNSNYEENCNKLNKDIANLENEKNDFVNIIEEYKVSSVSKEELVKIQTLLIEKEVQGKDNLDKLELECNEKVKCLTQELNTIKNNLSENVSEKECHELRSRTNELLNEKESLINLVDQYKTGLENTESILSKLQTSVYEEENKWRESLTKSESEAEKCTRELEKVYNELTRIRNLRADKNELNFAYHCVDKSLSSLIDEMEARMNHFEASLEAVIQERDNALAQVHMQMNGATSMDEPILLTNNLNNEYEMSKIKDDFINQVELNKTLEMHCNKYQSLIEIGKDALEAEKVQVKTLKEELELLQSKMSAYVNHNL